MNSSGNQKQPHRAEQEPENTGYGCTIKGEIFVENNLDADYG